MAPHLQQSDFDFVAELHDRLAKLRRGVFKYASTRMFLAAIGWPSAANLDENSSNKTINKMADESQKNGTENERVIVVAMDESPQALYALDFYKEHVHKPHDKIVLVHCPEYHAMMQLPAVPMNAAFVSSVMAEEEMKERKLMEKLGERLRELHLGGKVKSMSGNPGEAVVQAAKDENATMIVSGTRGMGSIRRTLLGSVSDYILHHSHVPVLVTRHKDDSPFYKDDNPHAVHQHTGDNQHND